MEEVVSDQENKESGFDWWRLVILFLLLVTFVNVLILDWVVGTSRGSVEVSQRLDAVEEGVRRLFEQQAEFLTRDTTVSATQRVVKEPTLGPVPTPQVVEKETVFERVVTQIQTSQVKEYYIPLGQATARTEHFKWMDTGAEAIVDLSNYEGVKQVTFEATLSVESGQVEVRLYNVTDGYAVYGSTLVGEGPDSKLYRSGNLVFHSGAKTYRVQMRTSMEYTAEMDNARIRILVE